MIYRVYRLIFSNTLFFGTPNINLAKEKHISKEEDYKTLIMFWLKVVLLVIDSSLFSILMLIDIVESIWGKTEIDKFSLGKNLFVIKLINDIYEFYAENELSMSL